MTDTRQVIIIRQGAPGLVAGLLASILAILGIFTLGFVFAPLAALCSVVAFARAAGHLYWPGLGVALIGCVLTVVSALTSPVLLVALGLSIAASNTNRTDKPATERPAAERSILDRMR